MNNKHTDKDLSPWAFAALTLIILFIVNQIEKF
jgi:hypothetical protein